MRIAGLHALLEYPQAYLYFLLPVGLMIGVIEARVPVHRTLALPRPVFGLLALALLAGVVFWDALRASNAYTEVRFAEARIGLRDAPAREQQRLCDINGATQCALWGRVREEWRSTRAPQGVALAPFQGRVLGPRCAGAS